MDYGVAIEVINGFDDAVLEFLLGCDADMAQDRAGELGEETLNEIKPGAVLGREGEFEATGKAARRAKPWSPWRHAPNGCRGSA